MLLVYQHIGQVVRQFIIPREVRIMSHIRLYDVKAAADRCQCSVATIKRRAALLNIPKYGRQWMFTEDDIHALCNFDSTPGPKGHKDDESEGLATC